MTLPKPSAVLFDWDGTIIDSMQRIHQSLNTSMQRIGRKPVSVQEAIAATVHARDVGKILWDMDDAENETLLSHFDEIYFNFSPDFALMPDAEEFFAILPKHMPLGVVSSSKRHLLVPQIEHLGWHTHLKVVVAVNEAPRNKPNADPILFALDKLKINPSKDVWYVGDTEGDVRAALAADITAILVTDHDYNGPMPDHRFGSMAELNRVMRGVFINAA